MTMLTGHMTFRGLADHAKRDVDRAARKIRDPEGDVTPRVYLYRPDGKALHVHDLEFRWFASRESKDLLVKGIITTLIELGGVTLVAFQTTVYHTVLDNPTDEQLAAYRESRLPPGVLQPTQDPRREEAVIVTVFDAEIREGWMRPISRDPRRPPTFGGWRHPKALGMLDGAMVNPIAEALR
jgi:hypothetical protein